MVGAGSAGKLRFQINSSKKTFDKNLITGAVMASRLSEHRNWTVLLIEAGGDETEISDVPALAGYLQLTDLDWQYQTAPPDNRAYCQAMIGDRCNWPRGKVMGGSSVLNAMVNMK